MSPQARVASAVFVVALGLLACGPSADPGACLPAARAEPTVHEVTDPQFNVKRPLSWHCEDPPPDWLLDGRFRTHLVWVDGEACDPCDRERIAAAALPQVCGALRDDNVEEIPVRLLCGPVPWQGNPWDRKGCVYAVASDIGVICD